MLLPYHIKGRIECGVDEAGRGCLAGPVTAAAVILPQGYTNELLNDSKKLSLNLRNNLREEIEHVADYAVIHIAPQEIDSLNILQATFLAMRSAIDGLKQRPEHALIDGNKLPGHPTIPQDCFVKGDGIYQSIAAASILAKTHRDQLMRELHQAHPQYDWVNNKGYGTVKHRAGLSEFGITFHHRKTFSWQSVQLELDL